MPGTEADMFSFFINGSALSPSSFSRLSPQTVKELHTSTAKAHRQELSDVSHYLNNKITDAEIRMQEVDDKLYKCLSKTEAAGYATLDEMMESWGLVTDLGKAHNEVETSCIARIKVSERLSLSNPLPCLLR